MPGSTFPGQLIRAVRTWWREQSREHGALRTVRLLGRELWEFARNSTSERRRSRYGDIDYDWDHRVNTTAGTVGWRERLLGTFLSAYQPTEPAAFREMMAALPIDFRDYTFVDLGSGKGRTLLMASDYPFRRIIGVEIVRKLHRAAEQNIRAYTSPTQSCRHIESRCTDAREFLLPQEPLILYLFNPLPAAGLREVLANLIQSQRHSPKPAYVVYHNPLLEQVLRENPALSKISGAPQYSVYAFRG